MCGNCGNHNFASRETCNKCATPRAESGQDMPPGPSSRGGYGAAPSSNLRQQVSPYDEAGHGMSPDGVEAAIAAAYETGRQAGMAEGHSPKGKGRSGGGGGGGPGDMKSGDWICPECGNHNFASRVNCNKCQALREGMREGDWVCRSCKNHNFARHQNCNKCKAPRGEDQMGKGRVVGGGGKGGKGCGGGGGYGMMMPPGPCFGKGGGPGYGCFDGWGMPMGPPMGKGDGWGMPMGPPMGKGGMPMGKGGMFPGMMMDMPMGMPMQPMGMPPGRSKGMKSGDWLCTECGNHNFASRTHCNKCNALRPGMKEGDWICRGCKNHNFASRQECNKCQAPREEATR